MDCTLISEQKFTLKHKEKAIKNLEVISEWNGFLELKNETGTLILARADSNGFFSTEFFESLFPVTEKKYQIIKASPALIDLIKD